MSEPRYYLEVVPLAYTGAAGSFTYRSSESLEPGRLVSVPLGRRQHPGVVVATCDKPAFATKAIIEALDIPPLPGYLLELAAWMGRFYAASPASVFGTLLPAGLTKVRRPRAGRSLVAGGLPDVQLTADQAAALSQLQLHRDRPALLHGVTGSGKTRVYLELAAGALAAGRSAIVLVPEITLTPQLVSQFEAAFGTQVIASHSKLTEAERHRAWSAAMEAVIQGEPRIIIGPRSSLFLPAHNLGLIVIDECHEPSYKQEQHPRYNCVTTAGRLSQITGAQLVLGSATPSLSELFLARAKRLSYIRMDHRANQISLPQAIIIDLRNKDQFKLSKYITQDLVTAVSAGIEQNRQSLFYLNRRGSASSQLCGNCGHVTTCPNCQLPLTFHADLMRLICHHCNYRLTAGAVCPSCGAAELKLLGSGTKRIEEEARRLWPEARIARLDRDSATLAHLTTVYKQLRKGEIDILIGTQMIAKGLDLPAMDTVGVISADTMLHVPDYTAAERTYQLLSQVSGRAGRGDRPGQIFLQTYTPDHPVIQAAAAGDYDGFAASELAERERLGYPPFAYLLKLELAGPSRNAVSHEATNFAQALRDRGAKVAGPAPAFIETRGGRFVWVLSVTSPRREHLVSIAAHLPHDRWTADLDPANLL